MKLKVGKNVVRFLPALADSDHGPFVTVYQHFLRIPGQDKPTVFNCPRKMANEYCPACAKAESLSATGSTADRKAASAFWPSYRVFASVLDRSEPNSEPKTLAFGSMIMNDLQKIREDEDWGDFTHPEDGFDIVIERTGTTMHDTEYSVRPARKSKPVDWDAVVDTLPDLDKLGKIPGEQEVKQLVAGGSDDEDEELDVSADDDLDLDDY